MSSVSIVLCFSCWGDPSTIEAVYSDPQEAEKHAASAQVEAKNGETYSVSTHWVV